MPYSVPPPPPPAVVEVQPTMADDVDSVNQLSVDLAADDRQVGRSPQSSARAHWPSLLSAPDVFAREFSGRSAIAPGTRLENYRNGESDASLLWGTFNVNHSVDGRTVGSGTVHQGAATSSTSSSTGSEHQASRIFTTTPLASLDEPSSHLSLSSPRLRRLDPMPLDGSRQFSDENGQAMNGEHSDVVPLNQDTLSPGGDLDADAARRSVQMSDDFKALAAELLLPIEDAFQELYTFAQQVEQSADADTGLRPSPVEIISAQAALTSAPPARSSPSSRAEGQNIAQRSPAERPPGESSGSFFDNEGVGPLDPTDPTDGTDTDASPSQPLDTVPIDELPTDDLPTDDLPSDTVPPDTVPSSDLPPRDDALEVPPDPIPPEPTPTEPLPPGDGLDDLEDNLGDPLDDTPGDLPDDPEADAAAPVQPVTPATAGTGDAVELTADRQVYDTQRRVFIAEGDVEMVFRGAILNADRVQVNLPNKIAVAEGDVFFTRGEQVLRGDRIEYNLVTAEGSVIGARGEIFLPGVSGDLAATRTDASAREDAPPLSDQLTRDQPPVETATSVGGLTIGGAVGAQGGLQGGAGLGEVRQIRFEADMIDFYPEGWEATNVRITNDPFSPPELELRAETATFSRLSPTRSELIARRPRLVFDQGLAIPLFRRRFVFDEERRNAALLQFGFDEDDRGGLFVEREFEVIANPIARLSLTPQIYLQRWFDEEPDDDLDEFSLRDAFGFTADLTVNIDPRTTLDGQTEFTSLDFSDTENEVRGSVRLNRQVLPISQPFSNREAFHTLTAEYSYRDRLFNGTLGFQTVQETYGLVLTSPTIRITEDDIYGQGIDLRYQAAIQRVNANVSADVIDDLLDPPPRDNNRATLNRYQVAAELRRFFYLWVGTPLPATPEEGLRYTPNPVVPFVGITPRVQGIASFYENGDRQPILTGEVTLQGQFGHFSRPYLDYFGFGLTYRRSTEGSESPFNFDRLNDREVFSASATAQLYGPLRAGIRTSINLAQNQEFDNSFFVEYSRRTYGVVLTYNPDREIGSLGLRLSDFNWTGVPEPFDTPRTSESSETSDSDGAESLETDPLETDPPETDPLETDPLETDPPETDPLGGDSLEEELLNDESVNEEPLEQEANDAPNRVQIDVIEPMSPEDDVESSDF